jgi:hypothetical protein
MGGVAFDCQFSGKPFDARYLNKRAEIWFLMAEWVKGGGALPYIPELVAELTTPTFSFQGDKLLIEPKEQVKKRLGRSPDLADGLAVTFAFPIAPKPRIPANLQGALSHNTEYDPVARAAALMQESAGQAGDYDPFNSRH